MPVPTSAEMGEALVRTGKALLDNNLITSDHIFHQLKKKLSLSHVKDNKQWEYEIYESRPVEFTPISSAHINGEIRPRIYASVSVETSPDGDVCFKRLDLALDIRDDEGKVLIKQHIDLANRVDDIFQDGPLFHLQFGGHTPKSTREYEVSIKEPRWMHAPLDVILLCEVVVANFYPEVWPKIKKLSGWIDPIIASQQLCIVPFLNELQTRVNVSSSTLLDHLWASERGPAYMQKGFSCR